MFGEPMWLTAEPRSGQGERHALAAREQYTACGPPVADFVVLAQPFGSRGSTCSAR